MDKKLTVYLSDDGQNAKVMEKSRKIIVHLESYQIEVVYESRDFVPGCSIYDNKRDAVIRCDIVVVILSDLYIDAPSCMYDVALAVCYERHIIVVDKRKSHKRIPSLLCEYPKISGRTSLGKLLEKLVTHIDCYRKNNHVDVDRRIRRDEAQTLIRDVEREENFSNEMALQREMQSLRKTIKRLYSEKKMQSTIYLTEMETEESQYKREMSGRVNEQMTARKLREKVRFMKTRERSLLEQIDLLTSRETRSAQQERSEETTLSKLQDQMNEILIHILGFKRGGNGPADDTHTITSEVRCFCEKYENMIGPNIRRFGQLLRLSVDQLNRVEEFRQHGYSQMFWQTIRLWKPTLNSDVTFRTFLNALEEVGVDIGGKPMPQNEVRVLHENIPYILDHCYRIIDLVVHLLSSHVLTEITQMYILEAKRDEDRLLRLVNVLTTKEKGIDAICDAFCKTNQKFIADKIQGEIPPRTGHQSPVEKSDYTSDSASAQSSDDFKKQVALVAPTSCKRLTPVPNNVSQATTREVIEGEDSDSDSTKSSGHLQYQVAIVSPITSVRRGGVKSKLSKAATREVVQEKAADSIDIAQDMFKRDNYLNQGQKGRTKNKCPIQ